MALYTPYGVQIQASGGSLTTIGGVTEQSIDTGVSVNAEVTAGAITPQFGEIATVQAGGRFTSHNVGGVLAAIGNKGACLAGSTAPGFAIWTLQRDSCGSLASGSVHRKLVIPNGRIFPVSLSVGQNQRASLVTEVIALYDGTNKPILSTGSQAAPTGLADDYGFHIGAVSVAGITVTNVTGIEINYGNTVQAIFEDGEVWPKQLNHTEHKPTITIRTNAINLFGSGAGVVPIEGLRATHADSSLVLRRKVAGTGSFSGEADHIQMTFDGVAHFQQITSSGNALYGTTIMITCLDDGDNEPIVADYAFDLSA